MKKDKNKIKRLIIPLKEAASLVGMCRQTLMNHVSNGNLQCVKFSSRAVYFRKVDLEQFINNNIVKFNPVKIPSYSNSATNFPI
jgi:predicted DNA-binding transcriptional regulator AlpA